jgi:thiamine biosynthesis lipoprotein
MTAVFLRRPRNALMIAALVAALLLSFFAWRHAASSGIVERTRFLMGSPVQIKVPRGEMKSENAIISAIDKAFDEVARLEEIFSVYKSDSEISRINNLRPGEKLKLSEDAFTLIDKSIRYNRITDGAFEITVKPLSDLWNVDKGSKRVPPIEEIDKALSRVGSRFIVLDRGAKTMSFSKEGMAVDLGGAAQGYAADKAIEVLKSCGVRNALVNVGGDMYCLGKRSRTEPWKVGIQHPRDPKKLFLEVKLTDRAINTSGDYEKYFVAGGRWYSHIIDPRTGYPVGDRAISATVITADSTTGDMLSTALCVLGREGLDVARRLRGTDAVIIFNEGGTFKVETTKNLRRRYEVIETAESKG